MSYEPRRQYQPFAFREGDGVFVGSDDGRRRGLVESRFTDHTGENLYVVRFGVTLSRVMSESNLWPVEDDSAN